MYNTLSKKPIPNKLVYSQSAIYVGSNKFVFSGLKHLIALVSDEIVLSYSEENTYSALEDKIDFFDVIIFDGTPNEELSMLMEQMVNCHPHLQYVVIYNSHDLKIKNNENTFFISSTMNEKSIITEFKKIFHIHTLKLSKEKLLTKNNVSQLFSKLSNREFEIARLMIKGYGNLEISNELNLKASTVSTFKSRIFQKLKIINVIQLVNKFDEYQYVKCV